MKIIAITGNTPRCGKDTAALHIIESNIEHCLPCPFYLAEALKVHTLRLYGINAHWTGLELYKDTPQDLLYGLTPRQAYIAHGEHMKQLHGLHFWSEQLVKNINSTVQTIEEYYGSCTQNLAVVSDLGFDYELDYLCQYYGTENVGLLQIVNNTVDKVEDNRMLVQSIDGLWFSETVENGHIPLDIYKDTVQQTVEGYFATAKAK